jgi:hypothetical protein
MQQQNQKQQTDSPSNLPIEFKKGLRVACRVFIPKHHKSQRTLKLGRGFKRRCAYGVVLGSRICDDVNMRLKTIRWYRIKLLKPIKTRSGLIIDEVERLAEDIVTYDWLSKT